MATFDTIIPTNAGMNLINQEIADQISLKFTRIVFSSDDYTNTSDSDVANLTALQNQEVSADAKSFLSNGITKIRGEGYNSSLNQSYYVHTIALYGQPSNGNETLIALTCEQTPDYMPAFNGNQTSQVSYTFNLKISKTDKIDFDDNHDIPVTIADVQSAVAPLTDDKDHNFTAKLQKSGVDVATSNDIANIQNQVNGFTIHDSYTAGNDMYAMPMGIFRLNNQNMIHTPYGDNTTIIGTVINYGWYTTYVDKTGNTFITSPDSEGWQEYASQKTVDSGFEYHGKWDISLAEFRHADTGVYQLDTANTDAQTSLNGWDGYGAAVVYNNGVDTYVTIYGHNGLQWNNHTINGVFGTWVSLPTKDDYQNLQNQINGFTIHDSYTAGNDMYSMPMGIWRMNNQDMIHTPYGDHTTIIGTVINYGWYTTYVDKTGNTFITSPESEGWHQYGSKDDTTSLQTQINATNSNVKSISDNSFKLLGTWTGSFLQLNTSTDGYWHIGGNGQDAPAGFSGWGLAIVYHNFGDCFVTLWDNANNQWRNHYGNSVWNGWKQF